MILEKNKNCPKLSYKSNFIVQVILVYKSAMYKTLEMAQRVKFNPLVIWVIFFANKK